MVAVTRSVVMCGHWSTTCGHWSTTCGHWSTTCGHWSTTTIMQTLY